MAETLDRIFTETAVRRLRMHHTRIEACLDKLSYEQVWHRSSVNANAVGNLVLHLCGNLGQWIGYGVGERADTRVRDTEFAAREGVEPLELKQRLRAAVEDAVAIIAPLTAEDLLQQRRIQNYDVTKLDAVFHAVEHFALHTGQIQYATKGFTGEDLGFYQHLSQTSR